MGLLYFLRTMSEGQQTSARGGILRRLGVLALGLFIAVLLLEGALRVVGFFHVRESQKRGSDTGAGTHKILCFGDSFTFGVGAASGEDYPSQLEKRLNAGARGKRFSVINRGVGGYNTSQVLSDFRGCVDEINPDMVVVMVGIHNPWNLWGYNEYKKGNTFWARAEKLLYRVRVFKLVILLARNIRDKQKEKQKEQQQPAPAPGQKEEPVKHQEPPPEGEPAKHEPGPAPKDPPAEKKDEHGGNGDDDEEHGGNGNGDDDEEHGGNGNGDDDEEQGDDKDEDMGFAGLVDTAVVRLERVRETDASYEAVIKLLKNRKHAAAAAWLKKRVLKEPKNAVCHFALGAIAYKQKKYAAAIGWFKKGMAADPRDVDNYCGMGNVYWEQRKYDDAIGWYKEAIKVAPSDPGNYSQIGRLHLDKNDQEGALRWFKEGIAVGQDTANYLGIVDIYLLRGKVQKAQGWLQKAIKEDPKHSELLNRLGIVHVRQKKYKEAIAYFERGIAADPRDIANYEELCKALRESKIPASKSVLKKLREAARTNKIVRNYISFLKRKGGDFNAEALAWAKHDLRLMYKICKERKIPFVIQSYPEPAIQLGAFAKQIGALFVNNERVFEGLLKGGEKKEKYFVPDGHCNARGYGVIAKNIHGVMVEAKLFDLK